MSEQVDVNRGLIHVMFPAIMGSVVAMAVTFADFDFGNPVQTSLLVGIALSPLLGLATKQERLLDHMFGFALLNGIFALMWFSPNAGFFCGGYLTMMIWVWMSLNWWKYELPSFRFGVWHAVGMEIGAFGGAIIASGLV